MVSVNWNILAVSVRTINVTGGSGEDNRMTTKIRVPKWLDVVINLIDFAICCNLNESPVLSRQVITAVPICCNNYFHLREFGIRKGLKKLVISSKIRIFIGENQ